MTRAERIGIIGFMDAGEARQRRALQAMGVEARLAGLAGARTCRWKP